MIKFDFNGFCRSPICRIVLFAQSGADQKEKPLPRKLRLSLQRDSYTVIVRSARRKSKYFKSFSFETVEERAYFITGFHYAQCGIGWSYLTVPTYLPDQTEERIKKANALGVSAGLDLPPIPYQAMIEASGATCGELERRYEEGDREYLRLTGISFEKRNPNMNLS